MDESDNRVINDKIKEFYAELDLITDPDEKEEKRKEISVTHQDNIVELVLPFIEKKISYIGMKNKGISKDDLDDMKQNFLVKVLEKIPEYDPQKAGFITFIDRWLFGIEQDYYKKRKKIFDNESYSDDIDLIIDEQTAKWDHPDFDQSLEDDKKGKIKSDSLDNVKKYFPPSERAWQEEKNKNSDHSEARIRQIDSRIIRRARYIKEIIDCFGEENTGLNDI